jgi:RimJ/RimL family protein N-acetyltransferase
MLLTTKRLVLVPATAQLIRWEMHHHRELGDALDALIPPTWPPENVRDVLDIFSTAMEGDPQNTDWVAYYWLSTTEIPGKHVLVGSGGFMDRPDKDGAVEIGYGTLDEFQNRGYATEAVKSLVTWANEQAELITIFAEADVENLASQRVLQKAGFVEAGAGSEPGRKRYLYNPAYMEDGRT